ncbi:MAG TPA: trans-4-hydroxy-L-proline dehydratase [Ignavibacteriaceae bacterium]|nr:trans-4-hydroxy-L-proline dehydratase [Ignavibacteriaceae bacterium]
MNERIKKLRKQSLNAQTTLSHERAILVTEFYKSGNAEKVSVPVSRALCFKYILDNKKLCINNGELIVGERGPAPKSTPTYPEICIHSEKDLNILNDREKVSFKSNKATRKIFNEKITPFWGGKSIRDKIFSEVDQEWKDCFSAGIFTEFMEQRAPGHTVLDNKIYNKGLLDFRKDIERNISKLNFYNDTDAFNKREELKAMNIAAEALIIFAKRYSNLATELAKNETDKARKKELKEIARICKSVPANAPASFYEALQYYWFIHLGVITELNTWDSFNPGRLDQHLYPFYKKDIEAGKLTPESAKELLQAFWIKFNNQPAPPKVGVTAQESNTYTDFCLINMGGLTESGEDAVNELSYILLDVIEEMRLLQPSSMIQVSKKNPDRFIKRALNIIKTGYGQPSIFNSDSIVQELVRQGKTIVDARNGGASGCVESGAFGKESYILTGYFNLVKILEITLNNGTDPRTKKMLGIETGDPINFETYENLFDAYVKQLNHFIDIKIKGNLIIERLYAQYLPAPFLSILVDDCISQGKDYNDGGARYNTSYIQGVGIGSITDSLSSIKYNVFDKKNITMEKLLKSLKNNFKNEDGLRKLFLGDTPKYGNDDDYADDILKDVFENYFKAVDGRPNTKGGHYRINLLPTTSHVYFGSVIGATPDGRFAGEPLSEGISPVQGADLNGPTAVIKSAAKIDHLRTGGTLLNQKFTPQLMETESGIDKITKLVRSYFRMDGHHIQFNVVTAELLRKAQKNPEKYRDLIVRVAGYSDYFVDLTIELQNEIINRTEQTLN